MAVLSNFQWGWAGPPISVYSQNSRSLLRMVSAIELHAARFHAKHSHIFASFQESYSFGFETKNTNFCNKNGNDLCKEFGILDRFSRTSLTFPSWCVSNLCNKAHQRSLRTASGIHGSMQSSTEHSRGGRICTNIFIALNIMLYVCQIVSRGKITLWGLKVNRLISDGQTWRLVTSSFLHSNVIHLLVNCFSLNSVGPVVEAFCGPKRFVAVYMASAVASSTMSYYLNNLASLGASGAIFGLVGSLAVFTFRHKNVLIRGSISFSEIAFNIAANMILGQLFQRVDNWGHVGGLIGGASLSWLIGPAFSFESAKGERYRVLVDKPPISFLLGLGRHPK